MENFARENKYEIEGIMSGTRRAMDEFESAISGTYEDAQDLCDELNNEREVGSMPSTEVTKKNRREGNETVQGGSEEKEAYQAEFRAQYMNYQVYFESADIDSTDDEESKAEEERQEYYAWLLGRDDGDGNEDDGNLQVDGQSS
jgi:hypothetical protein